MSATELRDKLNDYIKNADEARLEEIYNIIKDDHAPYNYSAKDIALFYKRRNAYLNNDGKNYTIEESFNIIRNDV